MFQEFLKHINTFIAFNCAICRSLRKSAQYSITTFYHRILKPNVSAAVSSAMTLTQCFTQLSGGYSAVDVSNDTHVHTHTHTHTIISQADLTFKNEHA
jgi:hypothetical protein